jgi:colanic acid/amylovoran biosynthesis glycosyltransferase
MSDALRIATFVSCFPVISETFILRQIAGLLKLGQKVDIYADAHGDVGDCVQPEVSEYGLMERTTFMELPPESAPWELPVWPLTGRTWPPGAEQSISNLGRFVRAAPRLVRCLAKSPRLTFGVLRRSEYGYQAASLSALYRLFNLIRREGAYDVLHAHFGPNGNSYRFARELWRAPLVVSFHGYDFSTAPRRQGADLYGRLFETVDMVTVNSEYTRSKVLELGCPQAKVERLPVGLDLEDFPFSERGRGIGEPLRILTVARLVAIKGHEYMLQAIAKLRAQHREIQYDIVGEGPLRTKLEGMIADLGLGGIVTLHGAQDAVSIRGLMAKAHLAIMASVNVEGDQEGQGLFLQEAQACGLPVLATRHGALPEGMIPDTSGYLVPERDVAALVERLGFLANHPERWGEMGRRGRMFVEQN